MGHGKSWGGGGAWRTLGGTRRTLEGVTTLPPPLPTTDPNVAPAVHKPCDKTCNGAFLPVWHTQINLFWILLNQPEIRLYLPFSDWFGSKWTSVWIQINRKMVNTIWFWFDFRRFWKDFSGCICVPPTCKTSKKILRLSA